MPTENKIQRWSANWHMEMFYQSPYGTHVTVEDHISSHAFDEGAERSACRKEWKRRNEHSHFEPIPFPDYWAGWKDCAQYRAKAVETDHE